jgi:glycosyltransferase involved in cell wall biosynthesis
MNICFLSYEFPPYPAGGIGSYVYRASRGLAQAGHRVTVIAGGHIDTVRESQDGVRVVRLRWEPPGRFLWQIRPLLHNLQKVARTCRALHQNEPFQIIEAPEYQAEAYYLLSVKPAPIITKLHTSGVFLWDLEARALGKHPFKGALARAMIRLTLGRLEERVIRQADRIHAPSLAITRVTQQMVGMTPGQIDLVPYPFYPSEYRQTSARAEHTILYVGRLEVCKGVHLFSRIIPEVLRDFPQARFVFLGRDSWYKGNVSMSQWLRKELGPRSQNCEFLGEVPYSKVFQSMRRAAVCIFPSLWENFPNVCLEAMDAGACVVGSKSGGMAEMLVEGESGLLADPARPETFAEKVKLALAAPDLRQHLGEAARQRLYELYRPEIIIPQQLAAYHKAIDQYYRS